jgi:hypothetical protein
MISKNKFHLTNREIGIQNETISWFSLGTPFSSTIKADSHDITEILLKVVLKTNPNPDYS